MDLDLIARLMQLYGEHPGVDFETISTRAGLNRPKIEGLNKLMGYLGLQQGRKLTSLGTLILEHDPYLKDDGTLSLFHYLLCSNKEADVWYFASNKFIPQNRRFTREEFDLAIDKAGLGQNSPKHLKSDKNLFLNTYTTKEHHALQGLEYLKKVEGSNDVYEVGAIERVSALIVGFALYDQRQKGVQTSTMSINNLLMMNGQVGKIFLFRRESLMVKLRQLEAKGIVGINQIADLDNIAFKHLDEPLFLLVDYYREQA